MAGFLEKQLALQRTAYGADLPSYRGEDRVRSLRMNVLGAIRELTEMLELVDGWKEWQTERERAGEFHDRDKFVAEGVDALHFLLNLLCLAGCDDEELEQRFDAKQAENAARQRRGYGGRGNEYHLPAVISDSFGISRSEARRLIDQGGVTLDGEVVTDPDVTAYTAKKLRVGTRRQTTIGGT